MRDAFSSALVRLAKADKNLILLTGDHGYALFDEFRKACPGQYINAGIAEQNMVGMAAGMARIGFRPFVYGLAAFIPIRTLEQIKLDIAHDQLPVVLLGDGAGFVYSHLGTSHQSTEDIACTRSIPDLEVLSPADRFEMLACMDYAYALKRPVYLRMGKADLGDVHQGPIAPLRSGELISIRTGDRDKPGIIATGSMAKTALAVAEPRDLCVWTAPILKPLLPKGIKEAAESCRGLITMEEHSILGGLGAAIAEITSGFGLHRVLRIGVDDRFSVHCGTYEYLLSEHGLDSMSVGNKIDTFLRNL